MKKILLLSSLFVALFGLASCDNYKEITAESAEEIIANFSEQNFKTFKSVSEIESTARDLTGDNGEQTSNTKSEYLVDSDEKYIYVYDEAIAYVDGEIDLTNSTWEFNEIYEISNDVFESAYLYYRENYSDDYFTREYEIDNVGTYEYNSMLRVITNQCADQYFGNFSSQFNENTKFESDGKNLRVIMEVDETFLSDNPQEFITFNNFSGSAEFTFNEYGYLIRADANLSFEMTIDFSDVVGSGTSIGEIGAQTVESTVKATIENEYDGFIDTNPRAENVKDEIDNLSVFKNLNEPF